MGLRGTSRPDALANLAADNMTDLITIKLLIKFSNLTIVLQLLAQEVLRFNFKHLTIYSNSHTVLSLIFMTRLALDFRHLDSSLYLFL